MARKGEWWVDDYARVRRTQRRSQSLAYLPVMIELAGGWIERKKNRRRYLAEQIASAVNAFDSGLAWQVNRLKEREEMLAAQREMLVTAMRTIVNGKANARTKRIARHALAEVEGVKL